MRQVLAISACPRRPDRTLRGWCSSILPRAAWWDWHAFIHGNRTPV